jgi:protein-disulfide isomerase
MKLRHISACVAVCFLAFQPTFAVAEEAVMIQGFDPLQAAPTSYSEAKRIQIGGKHIDPLFHHVGDPISGNNDGKVTLVEFFDYRCSHCEAMSPVLHAVASKNNELRVVYKEYPIRGKISVFAAKAALAANNQGKYLELHNAMMDSDNLDENKILNLAKSLGLDIDKLKTDMDSVAIEEEIRASYQLGRELGIFGTPTFYLTASVAGDPSYTISGEVDQTYLQNLVAKLSR